MSLKVVLCTFDRKNEKNPSRDRKDVKEPESL